MDRRSFLTNAAAVAAATSLAPEFAAAAQGSVADKPTGTPPCITPPPMPDSGLYGRDEEAYWTQIRRQFVIPQDEVYLNNGTVGSSPIPVLNAIFAGFLDTEQMAQNDPEQYPIWGYEPYVEFRDVLARFIGCTRDELALVRNATEANSYIANGLEMKPGDEVLMSDQEHPGGEEPWKLRAKRYGIVVKQFTIPKPLKSPADVLNRISEAITPRTRIIFTSHISTATGVVLPVKEIAALARSKNILSAFDGAHVPGMMKLNIHDIGCDMYTASPHKWLQATKGTGFLYVREEVQPQIWNTIVTHGWDEPSLKAERFMHIGSSNVPTLWGVRAAVEFADQIGMDRIEKRHRAMCDYLHGEMVKRGAETWTSPDPTLRCAIATVNVPPIQRMEMENWMWKTHKIRIRGGEPSKLRLSTPYFLLKKDIDRYLAAFDEFRKMKGIGA